jgi:hypothetical protein
MNYCITPLKMSTKYVHISLNPDMTSKFQSMNKIFLPLAMICLVFSLKAQRVDLDRFSFTGAYRDLPRRPLDSNYRTYSVSFELGPVMRNFYRSDDLDKQVNLDGWKRLSGNAHILVATSIEDIIIESTDVVMNETVQKDKNGKEIGRKQSFTGKITYSYASRVRVTDFKGILLDDFVLASRDQKLIWNTSSFTTDTEARMYIKFGYLNIMNNIMQQTLRNIPSRLSSELTWNYGFPLREVSDYLWVLNNRKHPDYEGHQRAWIQFRQAMMQMNPDDPLDKVRGEMQPVIDYYVKMKKYYAFGSRKDRKLLYSVNFNLSKIYYYMDDPENSMREAGELRMNGFDVKDGIRMEAMASELKEQFRQSKRNTRHFPVRIEEYQGPPVVKK